MSLQLKANGSGVYVKPKVGFNVGVSVLVATGGRVFVAGGGVLVGAGVAVSAKVAVGGSGVAVGIDAS